MKKLFTILVVMLCLSTMGVAAIDGGQDGTSSGSANVLYQVDQGYTWEIHTDIEFTSNKGVGQTDTQTAELDDESALGVRVNSNIIPDGKKLVIAVSSANGWKVVNGTAQLNYTATPAGGSALANGDTVLEVPAGTNTGSKAITFVLTTAASGAEVAGDYSDTLTYSASLANIVNP